MDFDPRNYDSRDDERHGSTPNRGNRGASDDLDRDSSSYTRQDGNNPLRNAGRVGPVVAGIADHSSRTASSMRAHIDADAAASSISGFGPCRIREVDVTRSMGCLE